MEIKSHHLSDREVLEGDHDFEFMCRPHLWPLSFLPLKHKERNEYGEIELAILFAHSPQKFSLIRPRTILPIEKGGEEMLRSLIEKGWEVD
jgi:hypothetical protein